MEDDCGLRSSVYQNDEAEAGPSQRRPGRPPNRSNSSQRYQMGRNLLSASQTFDVNNQQESTSFNAGVSGRLHCQNRPRNDSGYHTNQGQWRPNGNRGFGRSASHNRFNNFGPNRNQFRQDHRNNESRYGNRSNDKKIMRLTNLEEIARASESKNILNQINDKNEYFLNLLNDPDKTPDTFVFIIQLMAKVSNSTYDQLKSNLLLETCNSEFFKHLGDYLLTLPYKNKTNNKLYWANEREFWGNLISLCECIVNMLPSIALQKCTSLIETTTKASLDVLDNKHQFQLPEELSLKMTSLRERLQRIENQHKMKSERRQRHQNNVVEHEEPPDDFRQLNILPDRADLLIDRPFLRPNIINGAYRDVEHYLDVQFRLLREDCYGPLREGLRQYINDPSRKKFDHIRVFHNVTFLKPYVAPNKLGSMIQMDEKTLKRFKRINWAHNKRFLFGSLLLLTKDNCESFVIATILDRNVRQLSAGQIPVSVINDDNANMGDDLYNNDSYTLIESEVYFEPYLHVLKALRDVSFPEHLAMSKYIVHVNPIPQHPSYLVQDNKLFTEFEIKTVNNETTKFTVLQQDTWPSHHDIGLNESQFEAYKLALTHEFAVIQGPPGTGKTFLGIKIAETLLHNLSQKNRCLMLVICYTNHALDQFLEGILPFSESMVRIGGQSKSKAMEKININNLRRNFPHFETSRLFFEQKHELRNSLIELRRAQKILESLNNGVLSYNTIITHIPEIEIIKENYSGSKEDPLKKWLFEGRKKHFTFQEFSNIILNHVEEIKVGQFNDEDKQRDEMSLDNLQDLMGPKDREIENDVLESTNSFSLREAETRLKHVVSLYKTCKNYSERVQLEIEIINLKSHMDLYKEMGAYRTRVNHINIKNVRDITRMPTAIRWILYFDWEKTVMQEIKSQLKPLQKSLYSANEAYEEARMMMDVEIIQHMEVVGMTTSGAARMRKLLQALAPPIVIVEEAAEVLEAHIVTSLNKKCQHLILIGDHQQLRPSAAHMKLAREYNTEISLFERMIMNNIHSRRLAVQHRMRPEIAALISPHIYPDLQNHPTVEKFPNVLGVTKNLFFLTHNYKEQEVDDNVSRTNHIEADMTLKLANYLMQQGYDPEDITVLAAYSGQMFYMRKQRENYIHLSGVKITVVDNYQGEESKIILLSLVRNNDEGRIGFLTTENRICVALSRAKEGFYIFGNMDMLQKTSELWKKLGTTLHNNESLGTMLKLKCENHLNHITPISSPEDFEKVPEGGCLLKCVDNLPCGHPCPLICHSYDRGHASIECHLPCEKILCELEHVCPLKCYMKCQPCQKPLEKTLPCGHKKLMPCHKSPNDPDVECLTMISVTLPDCQHEANAYCYQHIKNIIRCQMRCEYRVDSCGHECLRDCHVKDDPDHEKYVCLKPCAKAKKGCSTPLSGDRGEHQCKNKCHEVCDDCNVLVKKKRTTCKHTESIACCVNIDQTPCRQNCTRMLPCEHFCKKKCFEACGDCSVKVKKIIQSCGHEVETECYKEATRELCTMKCERILSCGHQCPELCDKICDPAKCNELISKEFLSPCGHQVNLPCNVYETFTKGNELESKLLLKHCMAPCGRELECGHFCSGTCSQCLQGRLHVPCTQTCHQNNICGHRCEEPCNQVCPPCKKPCEVRCPHSRCRNPCGAPCRPCQEKCKRKCRHGECSRRCSEPCDREPCNIACDKRLRCGHACRGLCGEPCPDICKLCRPGDFPMTFLGDDFDDDAKFVLLNGCNHILELHDMDNLMTGDTETVAIRQCPFCRKPIVNTYRYKDLVNNMFNTEINPIKLKVYGTPSQINKKQDEIETKAKQFLKILPKLRNLHLIKAIKQINVVIGRQKKVSLLQLEMQSIYFNILDMVVDNYKTYLESNLTELNAEFKKQMEIICKTLASNTQKISQQQQKDIGNEIKRMTGIIQLAKLLGHNAYFTAKDHPEVIEAIKEAKNAVLTWNIYNQKDAFEALKKLQDEIKIAGIVTKEERDLVVKAIGLKAGHWYKCPNGHFYCIGECGGAMEISNCIECGAQIGGQRHKLLSDNRHAGELDGSRFAAWSEEYNNMANFNLNN